MQLPAEWFPVFYYWKVSHFTIENFVDRARALGFDLAPPSWICFRYMHVWLMSTLVTISENHAFGSWYTTLVFVINIIYN